MAPDSARRPPNEGLQQTRPAFNSTEAVLAAEPWCWADLSWWGVADDARRIPTR